MPALPTYLGLFLVPDTPRAVPGSRRAPRLTPRALCCPLRAEPTAVWKALVGGVVSGLTPHTKTFNIPIQWCGQEC